MPRRIIRFPLLTLGLWFAVAMTAMPTGAWAAQCNEECATTSDCVSTCPVCIGTCVSCYELGNATACLSADTGGNSNCQWDGQNCKSLTDVPTLPNRHLWLWMLLPLLVLVVITVQVRRRIAR